MSIPSLIPGYEYDIFISYRQKDNKGERWVTEFVNALKTELESKFKEDISVYFDENPHATFSINPRVQFDFYKSVVPEKKPVIRILR